MDKRRFKDGMVLVGFELPGTLPTTLLATTVSVCGDFNGWRPEAHPLTRLDDGRFRTEIVFPTGERHRFRYLVDGELWENDPAADDYAPNGLGTDDSLVDLTDTSELPVIGTASDGFGGPGLQHVRIQRDTWQRIEDEATARGVEPEDLMGDLIETAMSPHRWASAGI